MNWTQQWVQSEDVPFCLPPGTDISSVVAPLICTVVAPFIFVFITLTRWMTVTEPAFARASYNTERVARGRRSLHIECRDLFVHCIPLLAGYR